MMILEGRKMKLKILSASLVMLVFSLTLTALPVGAQSTIAVVPFENVNGDRSLDWLSAGIPETITNSLLAVKGIVLVDRVQLRKVMDEQKFQWSGMADERTAVKLGKIAGASIMVVGAFQKFGETVRLTARFVDVESARVLHTAQATGDLKNIFDLQDKIVLGLIKNLNIELNQDELAKVTTVPTGSLEAYQHFGQGALLEAKRDYPGAVKELQKATQIDPKFKLAKNKFTDIFLSLNKGNYWTYDRSGSAHGLSTFTAGGLEVFNGIPAFTYIRQDEVSVGTSSHRTIQTEYYIKKDDGIYIVGSASLTESTADGSSLKATSVLDPPFSLMYPYDIEIGKKWTIKTRGKGKLSGTISSTFDASMDDRLEVTGKETVNVPAGTFDCFVLKRVMKMQGLGNVTFLTWFAEGIGIVKQRSLMEVSGLKVLDELALREYRINQ
jgi:TolB-like protein